MCASGQARRSAPRPLASSGKIMEDFMRGACAILKVSQEAPIFSQFIGLMKASRRRPASLRH